MSTGWFYHWGGPGIILHFYEKSMFQEWQSTSNHGTSTYPSPCWRHTIDDGRSCTWRGLFSWQVWWGDALDICNGSVLETLKLFDQEPVKYDIQMTFPNSSSNNESKRYICLLTLQQTNSDTSLSCGPFVSTSSHQFQFQTLPSCSRRRLFRPAWSGAKVWSGHGGFPIESGISSMMRKKTRWKNVENAWKLREPNWFVETSFLYMEVWTRSRNDIFDHSFWATYTCDCPGY